MDSLSGLVQAMEQARSLTGLVCSPEEEAAAFDEFGAWARSCNLRGAIYRTIGQTGGAVWHVEVTTDRGAVGSEVADPRSWREAMVEVGLLTKAMIEADLTILRAAASDRTRDIVVTVTGCAYACCGRGWVRRDGYEQRYVGYVDNFDPRDAGTFMLYSRGVGTVSYVLALRFGEVEEVAWA